MTIKGFYEMFESKAMARGFDAVEMTYQRVVDFSTRVFRGEVDAYQLSEEAGLSLRGEYRGGIGYYYSELIDVAVIEEALEAMMKSAELMEVKEEFIPESDAVLSDEADYHPDLGEIHYPSVMPKMVAMEEALKERDSSIGEVPYNLYAMVERELRIMNSRGMDLSQRFNLNYYVLSALAREGERGKTAMDFKVSSRPDLFEDQGFTLGIAREARDLLAARPVPSGKIPVLLNNKVAAQFLGGFASLFSAEMVDKDLSLLKGRLGEKIGADILNILDDPTEERALIHRQFDDEGTLTRRQKLVEEGVLKAYLHNTKTGRKMGMSPGGNGLREGIKSQLGISPTNFFIEPGDRSLEAMISDLAYGLFITQIQALHSGLNAVSGDFSLPAQGYLIRDGKIQGSVDQITISSNIMAVFNRISDIGEDLYFHIPNGMGSVGSPSLLIEGISVAGE